MPLASPPARRHDRRVMFGVPHLLPVLILVSAVLQIAFVGRAILRPHREPAARLAWIVVILVAPVIGVLLYILFGEVNTGRQHIERMRLAESKLPSVPSAAPEGWSLIPRRHEPLFRAGQSVNGFPPVGGNRGRLLDDAAATIDSLVADIDAARDHVHILIYIWLPDEGGRRVGEALMRAVKRGVACRAMADDFGSRFVIRSPLWTEMEAAGVRLVRLLPIGNILLHPFQARIDIRDHRKIVVIDNRITYCGSQNLADASFYVEADFAPWIDDMLRFEGPVALQNQRLFVVDWLAYADEHLGHLLDETIAPAAAPGFPAQVIGTGPTARPSAMPEVFANLMYAARSELVISTPYYIPDEPLQAAICAAARRGIRTELILPRRNNLRIVAAASRSYYEDLLAAGVRLHEYVGGLMHAKTLTVDGEAVLIGSANLDRRSFLLNYENNILFRDEALARALRARQQRYIDSSHEVTAAEVAAWSRPRRILYNAVAMFGPVL
jgi:cardiolipin synthase A/B